MGGDGRLTTAKNVAGGQPLFPPGLKERRARVGSREANDSRRGAKVRLARLVERADATRQSRGRPNGHQWRTRKRKQFVGVLQHGGCTAIVLIGQVPSVPDIEGTYLAQTW